MRTPRRAVGVYYRPDGTIAFYGRRRAGKDIAGTLWLGVTSAVERALLEGDIGELEVAAGVVVRRSRADLDARAAALVVAADDAHFDGKRERAVLELILDEINVLRAAAGLQPRTVAQARNAYRNKLGR